MCRFSLIIFLFLVGEIFGDEPPLVPSCVLKADLDGLRAGFREPSEIRGFLQYVSHEFFVEHMKYGLSITCAAENRKCRYYDIVKQTWEETKANKLYYDGKTGKFFDMHEVICLPKWENDFYLLLTVEKQNRRPEDYTFMMVYKDIESFRREDAEGLSRRFVDLKAIYLGSTMPNAVRAHPVFQTKFFLDTWLNVDGEILMIKSSSTGVVTAHGLIAIRILGPFEYMYQYAAVNYEHEINPMTVTPATLKRDLNVLDPDNRCKKGANGVGFLEYDKEVLTNVRCVSKKYAFEVRVSHGSRKIDASITCPRETSTDRKYRCSLREEQGGFNSVKMQMQDDYRIALARKPPSPTSLASIAKDAGRTYPMVHYFHVDGFFKRKLLAMHKLLNFYCVRGQTEMIYHVPSFGRRDFTVPVKFSCGEGGYIEIGGGELVVFDDHSMQHRTVQKLMLNLGTNGYESPGARFEPGSPKAIRFVGTWRPEPVLKERAKSDIPLHLILDDLKALREEYLEAVGTDEEGKTALKLHDDVLVLIHGEEIIDNVRTVLIQADIICDYAKFSKAYFDGERLMMHDSRNMDMNVLNPRRCRLVNKNNEVPEGDRFLRGITYVTEDELAKFIRPFTSTITFRCHWYGPDAVFRVVLYTPNQKPVIDALFHCYLNMYLLRGPFRVLSESGSQDVVENVFIFVNEAVIVTTTDAYIVKVFGVGSTPVGNSDSMGPPIMLKDKYAVSMQLLTS